MSAVTLTVTRPIVLPGAIRFALRAGLVALMAWLGAFARLHLPWTPVPVTLQTFFVILFGLMMPLEAFAGLSFYLGIGIAGLPVFAGSGAMAVGGAGVFAGLTGGYLAAFIPAAVLTGRLAGKRSMFRMGLAGLAGMLLILSSGTAWIKVATGITWSKAMMFGFIPFIGGEFIKLAAAVSIAMKINNRR